MFNRNALYGYEIQFILWLKSLSFLIDNYATKLIYCYDKFKKIPVNLYLISKFIELP